MSNIACSISCLTLRRCVIISFPITWILFLKEYLWSPHICLQYVCHSWKKLIDLKQKDHRSATRLYEQSPYLHQRATKERTRRVKGRSRSISREATRVKAEGDSELNEEEEECLEPEKARERQRTRMGQQSHKELQKTKRGSNDNWSTFKT